MELKDKILSLLLSDEDAYEVDKNIDQLLGLNYEKVEKSIDHHHEGSYSVETLESSALLTSYQDFYAILNSLDDNQICLDLGSGYSRLSILSQLFKMKNIKSIEMVPKRVEETERVLKKHGLNSEGIECANFNDFTIAGDVFFLYLPVNRHLFKILRDIREMIAQKEMTIIAIESHGDLIPFLKNLPWLKIDKKIETKSVRHDDYIYFFKSAGTFSSNIYDKLLDLSGSRDFEFLIKDEDCHWLGSTYKAIPSVKPGCIELLYPERLVPIENIVDVITPPLWTTKWRELRFQNQTYEKMGTIKKIITSPEPLIEFGKAGRKPV